MCQKKTTKKNTEKLKKKIRRKSLDWGKFKNINQHWRKSCKYMQSYLYN